MASRRDLQRAALDGRAAGVGVGAGKHQRAKVGFDQLRVARKNRGDRGRHAGASRRAVTDDDAAGRSGKCDAIALDNVAIGHELHAGGCYLSQAVIHRHRTCCPGKDGEGGVGEGSVDRAGLVGPVVIAGRSLPHTVAAVDHAVVLRAGSAVPIVEGQAFRVDEVDLVIDRGLDRIGR